MAQKINSASVTTLNFDLLIKSSDQVIIDHFVVLQNNNKKRIFPKSANYNSYRINRKTNKIKIDLLHTNDLKQSTIVAIFCFLRPPNF